MPARMVVASALLAILAAGLGAGWAYGGDALAIISSHAVEWRQGGIGVCAALIAFQILVAGFGFLPASLIGLAIGFILGPVTGFAVAAIGTLGGAVLAFALARSALRPIVLAALAKRAFNADDFSGRGWRFVFMLRLSPVLPFAPTSYALGVMGLGWRDFLCGTLAALPSLAAYVWLGSMMTNLGGDARSLSHPLLTTLFWIGMAATLIIALQWGGRLLAVRHRLQMQ